MTLLTGTRGELELFEQTLLGPDAIRYFWHNTHEDHGVFFTQPELQLLLSRIGTTPAWDFVHVHSDLHADRWAQACGVASRGLVVEINGPWLVADETAPRGLRHNVGTSTWPYFASSEDLHSVTAAAAIQLRWLTAGTLEDGNELRTVDPNTPRR